MRATTLSTGTGSASTSSSSSSSSGRGVYSVSRQSLTLSGVKCGSCRSDAASASAHVPCTSICDSSMAARAGRSQPSDATTSTMAPTSLRLRRSSHSRSRRRSTGSGERNTWQSSRTCAFTCGSSQAESSARVTGRCRASRSTAAGSPARTGRSSNSAAAASTSMKPACFVLAVSASAMTSIVVCCTSKNAATLPRLRGTTSAPSSPSRATQPACSRSPSTASTSSEKKSLRCAEDAAARL
mmetsp:Transcript_18098/g.68380  ORF Transcript_18098/g.68380 Transcript_18098/m.68380 type:complete len:241 (+) Transcript_18098:554-1276(+)